MTPNIAWDILILKSSLFIWNSNITDHPIFVFAKCGILRFQSKIRDLWGESHVESAVLGWVVSLGLEMQVIQGNLTGKELEDKYCDLNFSSSSGRLPGHTSGWTQLETRGQGKLWTWTIRSASVSMAQSEEGGEGFWRGKWEKSSTMALPPSSLRGPSLSITFDPSEITESDISRLGIRLSN